MLVSSGPSDPQRLGAGRDGTGPRRRSSTSARGLLRRSWPRVGHRHGAETRDEAAGHSGASDVHADEHVTGRRHLVWLHSRPPGRLIARPPGPEVERFPTPGRELAAPRRAPHHAPASFRRGPCSVSCIRKTCPFVNMYIASSSLRDRSFALQFVELEFGDLNRRASLKRGLPQLRPKTFEAKHLIRGQGKVLGVLKHEPEGERGPRSRCWRCRWTRPCRSAPERRPRRRIREGPRRSRRTTGFASWTPRNQTGSPLGGRAQQA
jgi:hypothetical protein